MVDSASLRRITARGGGEDGRWTAYGDGGRKNGRSRGTEPRHGSHASTPIIRDSLTIGFPLAVTEIYRKPVHLVPRSSPSSGMRQIRDSAAPTEVKEIETRNLIARR